MTHISMTPFGRRATADLSAHRALAEAPCPAADIDKWAVLRDLTTARAAFKVSDRDLTVLQALLSFHPPQMLQADGPTIVFPSNARLAERLHGMPESTLRRHIATLVQAGLILRHDSPNGKRFARRNEQGAISRAFGFDMRPLLVRAAEIAEAAEQAREDARELHALRETVILHLRDIVALAGPLADVMDIHRALRRKLTVQTARDLAQRSLAMVTMVRESHSVAEISGGYDSQNERHIQDSNKPLSESEPYHEQLQDAGPVLHDLLSACPSSADYAQEPIREWRQAITTAQVVCPMMGITPDVWHAARTSMGAAQAAAAVFCILERFEVIRQPGAYLRRLSQKAAEGTFSVDRMIRSLLSGQRIVPS
ncbi:plasmid replication protein RepC [Falsirhodobacter halotolerans]|uniref:plasmid replication protein RepC n=1 Tax=Falsirhodobacter halotolerans TaxID=1146892 RepID=UPI001FD23BD8|nr:plasmid replication protein RepC [Falsirhodobacter halotolerans]MCJ8140927.1 replication initiation protein RepC [Falsirhodobacter halotolerans]